jgi:rRNA maturation protein Nop10
METILSLHSEPVQRSEAHQEPIDAIYTMKNYMEPCGVRPVTSMSQPVPFDPTVMYRVYFEESDTPGKAEFDVALPHANIFCQSDGERCMEYIFIPFTSGEEIEWLERIVMTGEFLRPALKRWGIFRLLWGGPSMKQVYHKGANMLVDYWNGAGAAYLRRVGVPSGMSFADVLSDYLFLRDAVRMLDRFNRKIDCFPKHHLPSIP